MPSASASKSEVGSKKVRARIACSNFATEIDGGVPNDDQCWSQRSILDWVSANQPSLAGPLAVAKIARREHSGAGFYAYLVQDDAAEWDRPPVAGPTIESKDLEIGGGSVLWLVKGRPTCLEVYAFGDSFPEDLDDFELSGSDSSV